MRWPPCWPTTRAGHPTRELVRSGYARLERGETVLLLDAGAAPPLELAGAACAGCLSFEMSTGGELLLVNGGTPGSARPQARCGARHRQPQHAVPRRAVLGQAHAQCPPGAGDRQHALRHPDRVACEVRQGEAGAIELEASHDGYVEAFGLVHTRTLTLDAAGTRFEGCDRLTAAKGTVRFPWDVPFAVHFHLHPDAEARVGPRPDTAELLLDSGAHWRLTASGAAVSIEESQYFADTAGVLRTRQLVLRAQCYGATEVSWTLERMRAGQPTDPRARKRRRGARRPSARLAETSAGFDAPPRIPIRSRGGAG